MKNWEEKLSLYIEGALSPDEMLEIEAELEKNEALRIKHDNLQITMNALRDLAFDELPFGLQHKMLKGAGRGKRRKVMRGIATLASVAAVAAFVFIMIHIYEDATPGVRFDTGGQAVVQNEEYQGINRMEAGINIDNIDGVTPEMGFDGRTDAYGHAMPINIIYIDNFYEAIAQLQELEVEILEINSDEYFVTIRFFRDMIDQVSEQFDVSSFTADDYGYWTAHIEFRIN